MKDYLKKAWELKEQNTDLNHLMISIREYLLSHFQELDRKYQANSILESRFTPPEIAFVIGMNTCGSKVNIATEMLRHLGYKVKKVHGSIPNSKDHAWIKVQDPLDDVWKNFDLTREDCQVTSEHELIAECDEWIDIKEKIIEAIQ